MRIQAYQTDDARELYAYWQRLGASIPYFFPVGIERWHACLLDDELNGEKVFAHIETYFATVGEQIVGLVQFGMPHVAWDTQGVKAYYPRIGVIRHLYFEKGRRAVGEALLAQALRGMAGWGQIFAFFHILGMSCNAYHGKLHCNHGHIEPSLLAHGFQTEHENVYYVLDMKPVLPGGRSRLSFSKTPVGVCGARFVVRLDTRVVGTAQVRYVDKLTGGYTPDVAYLTWLRVEKSFRGQGIGTELMGLLVKCLLGEGYRCLHTDTARDNIGAQRFYRRLGFEEAGYTRSYIWA